MDDDLAYADVFTLRRENIGALALTEALLERLAAVDSLPVRPRPCAACWPSQPGWSNRKPEPAWLRRPPARHPGPGKGQYRGLRCPLGGASSLAGRPALLTPPLWAASEPSGAVILGTTNLSQWANIRSARSTSGWSAVGGLTVQPLRLAPQRRRLLLGLGSGPGRAPRAAGHRDRDRRLDHLPRLAQRARRASSPRVGVGPDRGGRPHLRRARTARAPWPAPSRTSLSLFEVLGRERRASSARVAGAPPGLRVGAARSLAHRPPRTDDAVRLTRSAALRARRDDA